MNGNLNERFSLKGERQNFSINFRESPEDREVYFGKKINEKIIQDILQRYLGGTQPKKFIFGQYGVGKTHTLYNIKFNLEEGPNRPTTYEVRCCFIDAEFREKTNYNYLHEQMMEALTLENVKEVIDGYLAKNAGPNLENELRNDFGDANIARAVRAISFAGQPITLWKWLCGGTLTAPELNSYQLTKNLNTISELYKVLVGIVRLFVKKGIRYLFLLDEMEGLHNVGNIDCQESFHDAFRRLADDENNVVGFIVSIHAMQEENLPRFIFREDIKTRLNMANVHNLEYLESDENIREFLTGLFSLVIDDELKRKKESEGKIPSDLDFYPLTNEAMEELVSLADQTPIASLPRNFISALNEGAVQAALRDSYLIDVEDLEPARQIFIEGY